MLGLLTSSMPVLPSSSRSCWAFWVDHILKHGESLGIRKAALFNAATGSAVASSSGWRFSSSDIANLLKDDSQLSRTRETLRYDGKTYIIKTEEKGQMVAFNGRSYIIVTRSKSMYIVVLCQSRTKSTEAASWMRQLRDKLVSKDW